MTIPGLPPGLDAIKIAVPTDTDFFYENGEVLRTPYCAVPKLLVVPLDGWVVDYDIYTDSYLVRKGATKVA